MKTKNEKRTEIMEKLICEEHDKKSIYNIWVIAHNVDTTKYATNIGKSKMILSILHRLLCVGALDGTTETIYEELK